MYKIIGADQKEYGPISLEQLQQWVREGRVNGQTLVQAEGSTGWKPLATYPELAPLVGAPPPGATPVEPPPAVPGPIGAPPPGTPGPIGIPGPIAAPYAVPTANAAQMVQGPATGLLVAAIIGIVWSIFGLFMNIVGQGAAMRFGHGAEMDRMVRMLSVGGGIVGTIFHIVLAGLVIYGAVQMKKLTNYSLAMAAAIVALVPCVSPCCLVGLPIGIWALVILLKPEVKSAFH